MRVTLFALTILLAIAPAARAQSGDADFLARTKAYDVAIAAKDAAKVATFYGDNAMSFANGIETVKGRVAIQKSIVDKLKNGLADMTIAVTEVRSDGDIGFRVARFRFPATTNGVEGASGTVFENWKRTKGKWLIAYENYIDDPKPAAKANK